MEEGRLVKWLKNEGDKVSSGETLAEVETDKAVMELVARGEGVLRKRLLGEGHERPVGQLVAVIAAPDENIDALVGGAAAPAAAKPGERGRRQRPRSPRRAASGAARGRAGARRGVHAAAAEGARCFEWARRPAGPGPASPEPAHRAGARRRQWRRAGAYVARSPAASRARAASTCRRFAAAVPVAASSSATSKPRSPAPRLLPQRRRGGAPSTRRRPTREGDFKRRRAHPDAEDDRAAARESIGPIPTFYLTAEYDMTNVVEMRERRWRRSATSSRSR